MRSRLTRFEKYALRRKALEQEGATDQEIYHLGRKLGMEAKHLTRYSELAKEYDDAPH